MVAQSAYQGVGDGEQLAERLPGDAEHHDTRMLSRQVAARVAEAEIDRDERPALPRRRRQHDVVGGTGQALVMHTLDVMISTAEPLDDRPAEVLVQLEFQAGSDRLNSHVSKACQLRAVRDTGLHVGWVELRILGQEVIRSTAVSQPIEHGGDPHPGTAHHRTAMGDVRVDHDALQQLLAVLDLLAHRHLPFEPPL